MSTIFFLLIFASECENQCQREMFDYLDNRIKEIGPNSVPTISIELVKKEESLKQLELKLKKKSEELALTETELGNKIRDFNKQQELLINCQDTNKEEETKRLKQVVETISNMKPDAAAKLLNIQETSIAVRVLSVLPPEKVAKIFNLMDPATSAKLHKQYMTMQKG